MFPADRPAETPAPDPNLPDQAGLKATYQRQYKANINVPQAMRRIVQPQITGTAKSVANTVKNIANPANPPILPSQRSTYSPLYRETPAR
jgi:hypothetical protein